MCAKEYIQVILPLKLEWVPTYYVPTSKAPQHPSQQPSQQTPQQPSQQTPQQPSQNTHRVQIGDKVRVIFSGREYVGVVESVSPSAPEGLDESKIRAVLNIETALARVSAEEIEFWKQLADYYMCTVGEVFKTACPARKIDREEIAARKKERLETRMEKLRTKIEKARKDSTRDRYAAELKALQESCEISGFNPKATEAIELSESQQAAVALIKKALKSGKVALLDGVTGSGKTEIYSKMAGEVLKAGRNVLYLVPEIALSRQLEDRLETFFGDSLLVFHSHETVAQRGQVASVIAGQTAKVIEGQAASAGESQTANAGTGEKQAPYIVLGTRSALFLPHHDLGLIIVDEEHDSSYKQDSPAPRYNGRDAAIMLARLQGAKVILGSATPSLESEFNAQAGRYVRVPLADRYHGGEPAEVEIIDTKAERRKRGMHGSFSRKLIQHINETLEEGGQVLILRGRRSYSPAVQCSQCGDIPKCPRCNISLSLHKTTGGERLVCHHCGHSVRYDGNCHVCGGKMEGIGAGTQKIEEEATTLFPQARIARLDSDVTKNPKEEAAVIKSFADGSTDILVGTQLVSKGFDFEKLKLVAVMQADTMLAVQDFRADERAVQLLEQVRGRCARRGGKGLFVIQTALPEHPVYSQFTSPDFHANLLEERKDFGYPPYYRMIHLNVKDTFEDRADRMATALVNSIYMTFGSRCDSRGKENPQIMVTGPYTPVRDIDEGRHVKSIRISMARTKDLAELKRQMRSTILKFETDNHYDGHIAIDVDPI